MRGGKLAAAVTGAAILTGCSHHEVAPEKTVPLVRVLTIDGHAGSGSGVRYSANIKPQTEVNLEFKVGGYVQDILSVRGSDGQSHLLQEGDWIPAGTVLARVRQADYQSRVDQVRAQLANSAAGVGAAQSKRGESRASLEGARSSLAEAVASRLRSSATLAEAKAGEAQAQSGLAEAEAAREQAQTTLAEAQAASAQAESLLAEARAGESQAQANLLEAQAARKGAQAGLADAQASMVQATDDFERARKLLASQSLTRAEFDAAKARHDSIDARVDAAREQVSLAQAREENARAALRATSAKIDGAKSALTASQARISGAKALVNASVARVERAKGQIQASQAVTQGAGALVEAGDAQIQRARSQVKAVEEVVLGAGAMVRSSRAAEGASKALLTETQLSLTDAALKAPLSAVVLKRNVEVGSLVSPGAPGFVLADVRSMKAVIGVPDKVVQRLKLGDPLDVTTDAVANLRFKGHITSISPAADPRSRVFNIEVTVPNPKSLLKVGMIATIELDPQRLPATIPVVPLAAIVRSKNDPNGYAVVVVEKQGDREIGRLRDVRLGEASGNGIAILNGLERGEQVVILGAALVTDGDLVRVIP